MKASKEVLEAFKMVVKYCYENKDCKDCPVANDGSCSYFTGKIMSPDGWEVVDV